MPRNGKRFNRAGLRNLSRDRGMGRRKGELVAPTVESLSAEVKTTLAVRSIDSERAQAGADELGLPKIPPRAD